MDRCVTTRPSQACQMPWHVPSAFLPFGQSVGRIPIPSSSQMQRRQMEIVNRDDSVVAKSREYDLIREAIKGSMLNPVLVAHGEDPSFGTADRHGYDEFVLYAEMTEGRFWVDAVKQRYMVIIPEWWSKLARRIWFTLYQEQLTMLAGRTGTQRPRRVVLGPQDHIQDFDLNFREAGAVGRCLRGPGAPGRLGQRTGTSCCLMRGIWRRRSMSSPARTSQRASRGTGRGRCSQRGQRFRRRVRVGQVRGQGLGDRV
ncbi:hypothetical protein L202_04607 [Cryptococcus amylolentus CBS 6039]|uniref:Uncharacterized protein n=1 Tax=Cryptococcus amylolentus CBS 6039 TaxID=1295533 RepID=A0A1E3HM66_9TREE|nr:hypothetical protein L202_04607 [Cryptococcus amylolentus CBS 6039]ODN77428.1 hypothetical protein L202_04607 [Cryptococcus amylolentus CBS 6039]